MNELDSYFLAYSSGREVICLKSSNKRMMKLTLTSMRSANFFHMNSFELQEKSLDTFNKFVGLVSPTKGLQEKHFIWKWLWS